MRIGLIGAGAMGSALGASWAAGGAEVITSVAGRSSRTASLARAAGVGVVESLDEVVHADLVVSTVPPAAAVAAARSVAAACGRTGSTPVVLDLNAVSPTTLGRVASALHGMELVDGSISGGPPSALHRTQVYVSGALASWVADIPSPWVSVTVLGPEPGTASALKMCTASMYKGTNALILQAMITAGRHGVLDAFLDDVSRVWPDQVPGWPHGVAMSASKADRFVGEMHEIAMTQRAAGVSGELFGGVAAVWARVAGTPAGSRAPEDVPAEPDVEHLLADLVPTVPAGVLFDFSGTLFHLESAHQSLLASLGASFVDRADALQRSGGLNGSSRPSHVRTT